MQQNQNKNSKKADAFCFTFLPIDIVETYKINTQNQSQIKQFVENTIYQSATKSDLKFSSTKHLSNKNVRSFIYITILAYI